MKTIREIKLVLERKPTIEGAGVRLKRVFSQPEVPLLDPFLLLDDFGSDNPEDYLAGFPWHPHRGIETVTYMIRGEVKHGDSLGNKGAIRSGDVQWMTAGSGIIHEEMPQRCRGRMQGCQLWVNLPSSHKMMTPRYRGITTDEIPDVRPNKNIRVRVIAGEVDGVKGPVGDVIVAPEYLDVTLLPDTEFERATPKEHTAFAYVLEGKGWFDSARKQLLSEGQLALFRNGDAVRMTSASEQLRVLFLTGRPIGEPVAWYGPIVMNTDKELETAFEEYRNGTFIRKV